MRANRLSLGDKLAWRSALLLATMLASGSIWAAQPAYTKEFRLQDCTFSDRGQNTFFVIEPGYHQMFKDNEGDSLAVTVLKETRMIPITLTINGVEKSVTVNTRVLKEEEQSADGTLEVSLNYYARCKETNSIFYFGEDTTIYSDQGVSHEGSWLAGQNGAMPGLIMPGTFLVGSRYFQELAAPVAEDQSEHIAEGVTVDLSDVGPLGKFSDCVQTLDTNPLEGGNKGDTKFYCPGIGLTVDEALKLVSYGFD